jgi:CRP/FNR family transcriptional regulator, cyclic AMP receptor protein
MSPTTIPEGVRQRFQAQLVQALPRHLVDELTGHHTTVTYAKGSILFSQGALADLMFWVVAGMVKVYCPMSEGSRILVRLCGPGDMLGYVNYLDPDGRRLQSFEAQALSKCTVALLTREHVARMLEKLDQAALIRLLEQVNTAWSSVAYRFATFLGLSFRRRLDLTLKDLAARFGVPDQRGVLLPIKLSHADLAELVNGSRPMVTRLISEMLADGSLCRDGRRYALPKAAGKNGAAGGQPSTTRNGGRQRLAVGPKVASRRARVRHRWA